MRTIVWLLGLMAVGAVAPHALAYNDCETEVSVEGRFCLDYAPPVTPAPYDGRYYLYIGWGDCTPFPVGPDCEGTPSSPGSGTPLPTGGSLGFGQLGILYEEWNNCDGLQRFSSACGFRFADNMMLV